MIKKEKRNVRYTFVLASTGLQYTAKTTNLRELKFIELQLLYKGYLSNRYVASHIKIARLVD